MSGMETKWKAPCNPKYVKKHASMAQKINNAENLFQMGCFFVCFFVCLPP